MWVFDATPLIYLARVGRLEPVLDLAAACPLPEPVHEEVVNEGLEAGYPDARRVEAAVEAGQLTVRDPPAGALADRLERNDGLSSADISVLTTAAAIGGTAVMDERRGRGAARVENIPVHGTAFLVLALLREGELSQDETLAAIDEMIDAGWHCSTDLYGRLRDRIDEFAKG